MDMVRVPSLVVIAFCAVSALVSKPGCGHAETAAMPVSIGVSTSGGTARFDGAIRAFEDVPIFTLSGRAFSAPASLGQTVYGASLSPRPRSSLTSSSAWDPLVEEAALRFGIPPEWVRGVMRIESGGRARLDGRPITSLAGAMGLMQVMPATFAELSKRYGLGGDPYEPRANILAGAAYLREMYDRFGSAHFLAAYNAGPGRVEDYLRSGGALPYETQRYVATLAPRLIGSCSDNGPVSPAEMHDLTSPEAVRDAAALPFQPQPATQRSSEPASLFFTARAPSSTRDRHGIAQPGDGLFVRLPRLDQRRAGAIADVPGY